MMKKLKAIIPLLCVISSTAHGYDELLKDKNKYTESGRKLIYLKASQCHISQLAWVLISWIILEST